MKRGDPPLESLPLTERSLKESEKYVGWNVGSIIEPYLNPFYLIFHRVRVTGATAALFLEETVIGRKYKRRGRVGKVGGREEA